MLDYERLTVRDLKRIVNREEATPSAIGLFVVYDMWEREHGRRAVVDNTLLRYIEGKWAFTTYANELDYWVDLGGQLRVLGLRAVEQSYMLDKSLNEAELLILRTETAVYASGYRQLYKQALEAGIEVDKSLVELLEKTRKHERSLPYPEEIGRATDSVKTETRALMGYIAILEDISFLLDFRYSGLLARDKASIAEWIAGQEAKLQGLIRDRPATVVQLQKMIESINLKQVDPSVTEKWAGVMAAYFSPDWRAWAQAGVKLRPLADVAESIVDLVRIAEQVAAEIRRGQPKQ